MGPMLADDSNGENARSLVALLTHGAFSLLITGDLTGGGSDTDPVEGFYVNHMRGIPAQGVDVIHAGHHGRNTSSSEPWIAWLVPDDTLDRNVIMGISDAHLLSPHAEVLNTLSRDRRLGEGHAWATTIALGGATHPILTSAEGGWIVVSTVDNGDAYVIQAVGQGGEVMASESFTSVRCGR